MDIKIEKLTDINSKYFNTICHWQAHWWAKDYKEEKVIEWMSRCLQVHRIPQTYIAIIDGQVVGMYQLDMQDDIDIRPDYYPWLVNVYVDASFRGKGILNQLMKHLKEICKELQIDKIYLHTEHKHLYEKYHWQYLEEVETLKGERHRIYCLDIK
jgi:GNAT superfamily N-acetyltransferase